MTFMNKKTKYTILVSGASGVVGYGILKALNGLGYKLIGTTIYDNSPANCFSDIVEIAPKTTDDQYINWLLKIIEKYNINMIIPGIEADMYKWNAERTVLEKSGVFLLLNNPELIELCADKWLFYKKLLDGCSEYAIPTALNGDFADFKNNFGLPFLLKPRSGFASKGIIKVESQNVFEENRHNIGTKLMVQPIIGTYNQEYTVSAFFDKDSKLLCYQQLKRTLAKEGFTAYAETASIADMNNILVKLSKIFKPIGPTNFQFRLENNKLKLLEINPRVSSATSIRTSFGYNESKMSVDYFLENKKIDQPLLKSGTAIRYTEDFIIYDSNHI